VEWGISTTAGAEAVVVCLHGRGASHRFAFDGIAVHRFVAAAGLPWAVVAIDGGPASYWHRRRDGSDRQAMVFDELLPLVGARIGAVPVFLLGWSMGGYGALLAATDHPDRISAVAASSPAVWRSFDEAADGAFDDPADFERNDLFDRAPRLGRSAVRIDCGRDDPFYDNVRSLAQRAGVASTRFGDGFHDSATWRSFVPEQLHFFRSAL
jgi:enterochelin esterase-like enzyme